MKIDRFCTMGETFGLRLENCGLEHCVPNFSMRPLSRDIYLFHYVMAGEGELECGGRRYPFSEREIFAIFPHNIVSYRATKGSMLKFCWFGIDGANAGALTARVGLYKESPICRLEEGNHLVERVRACIEACEQNRPHTELLILSLIYRLFEEIESRRITSQKDGFSTHTPAIHVTRAKSYIAFNYMTPMSISEVARHINLERTYFSRIFHEVEGVSPQEYLLTYRIEIACRLLHTQRDSIKDVGALVGIPDPYYFSRAFKKLTGMSPSLYRKNRIVEGAHVVDSF